MAPPTAATRQSTRANLGLITTLIAEGSPPNRFHAPEEALSYARSFVHEGLSFELLTQAFQGELRHDVARHGAPEGIGVQWEFVVGQPGVLVDETLDLDQGLVVPPRHARSVVVHEADEVRI